MFSILALVLLANLTYASNDFHKFTKISNFTLDHVIANPTVRSVIQCCRECSLDTNCVAVNYNRAKNICELNNVGPIDSLVNIDPAQNINVYYKQVAATASCESGWVLYESECYLFVNSTQSWTDSDVTCTSLGANLVDIYSDGENTFVCQLVLQSGTQTRVWIGMANIWTSANMTWSTGGVATYQAFSPGEPNNSMDVEDCVELDASTQAWNDRFCGGLKHGVCKKKA